jgi:hypothetical protein
MLNIHESISAALFGHLLIRPVNGIVARKVLTIAE